MFTPSSVVTSFVLAMYDAYLRQSNALGHGIKHLPKIARIASSSGVPASFFESSASTYQHHANDDRGNCSVMASNSGRALGIVVANASLAHRSHPAASDGFSLKCVSKSS